MVPLLILAALFTGCSDDNPSSNNPPVNETDFRYPVGKNSFWYYSTYNFVTNHRPDSIKRLFPPDTITGYGLARFSGDTVLNGDTISILRNSHTSEGHEHTTIEWYASTDSGLFRRASYSSGTNFGPFRPVVNGYKLKIRDRDFFSGEELMRFFNADNSSGDTTLYPDNPPIRALRYPVAQGIEWTYADYLTTRISKQYGSFTNESVPAGNFYCVEVKRKWYFNNSPSADTTFSHTDYFSKSGMVKREFIIKNVMITNAQGQLLGYIDVIEQAILNIASISQ